MGNDNDAHSAVYWERGSTSTERASSILNKVTGLFGARHELKRLFLVQIRPRNKPWRRQVRENHPMDSDIERAHVLLLQHPVLASLKFGGKFPLQHLLQATADAFIITVVVHMNKKALKETTGQRKDLPLHMACSKGYPHTVIQVMFNGFPDALRRRNDHRFFPIHYAIKSWSGVDSNVVKFLVEQDPSMVMQKGPIFPGGDDEMDLLQLAFFHSLSRDEIDIIVRHYCTEKTSLDIECGVIGLDQAEALCKILPQLKTFKCWPTAWTIDGFVTILKAFEDNQAIETVAALLLPNFLTRQEKVAAHFALTSFISKNRVIKAITFALPSREQGLGLGNTWMATIAGGMMTNHQIRFMQLENFRFSENVLTSFLADGSAPERTSFLRFRVEEDPEEVLDRREVWKKCAVRMLVMIPDRDEDIAGIANKLPHMVNRMPALTIFGFVTRQPTDIDMTQQAVQIIEKNYLGTLVFMGPRFDCNPICEALKTNRALRMCHIGRAFDSEEKKLCLLNVLQTHNTSLTDLGNEFAGLAQYGDHFDSDVSRDERVKYWTNLNECGRAKVRSQYHLLTPFVDLLCNSSNLVETPMENFNVHFGLLREKPALWLAALR